MSITVAGTRRERKASDSQNARTATMTGRPRLMGAHEIDRGRREARKIHGEDPAGAGALWGRARDSARRARTLDGTARSGLRQRTAWAKRPRLPGAVP